MALLGLAAVMLAALGVAGCGGSPRDPVIVRVGNGAIGSSTFDRAMTALAPERIAPHPPRYSACIEHDEMLTPEVPKIALKGQCEQQYRALRIQALDYLISSSWLIEEAASRHLQISAREIDQRLRVSASVGALLPWTTRKDAVLQARSELSALKLRAAVLARAPRVTPAQVGDYYRRHIAHFERQELRYVNLAEAYPTVADARRAKEAIEAGADLARISFHEVLERFNLEGRENDPRASEEAIFAAKPHVLSGPIHLNAYSIFEVTRIVPRRVTPLALVERSIERQLERERHERDLSRFVAAWRARWTARTDCTHGYVVEGCRQYAGPSKPVPSSTSGEGGPAGLLAELLKKP